MWNMVTETLGYGIIWPKYVCQRSRVNPSRKTWRCCLQIWYTWCVCVWWNDWRSWRLSDEIRNGEKERWGREGRKTKEISNFRYKGTCTKMSHEQTTSVHKTFKHDCHNWSVEVTSSQRCITHLWLLQRTNKYVLTKNLNCSCNTTSVSLKSLNVSL